ncbi:MAG: hypothetical protein ABJK20_07310 [Halieaceae bacterium]
MHELVLRINDPDKCYVFARNATRNGHPELALQVHRRAVDLRAETYEVASDAEFAAVRAIFAYEEALGFAKGKRTRATGTWQMVARSGLMAAVAKRLESRGGEDVTATLKELGMEDYSFRAVIDAYPEAFESPEMLAA